jgi:GNAT superfamily N-acetyltransferase
MHLVEQDCYEQVRPLFAGLVEIHLNVTAVLDGDCPGQVYVDNPGRPQTALLVSGDGYYLAGDAHGQAFNAALNAFLPGDTYFVLFCDLELWRPALDVILKHKYAVRAGRRYYALRQPLVPDWPDRIPEGFTMQPVDAALLARGLQHGGAVQEGVLCTWRTLDLFSQRGFGFCLVHGGDIASWSLCDFVSGSRCEIGITTAWDYRRRGLGTLTAAATAAQAAARGFTTVGWHCWANNAGSIGVAENVGFVQTASYDVFINHWAAENISDMTQDEFRAFAESYERWFEAEPPTSGYPHVVAATAWASARERGRCFQQLHRAVDVGWLRSVAQLRELWPELFLNPRLEQMEEWLGLRERLESN